jgi:putative SOS response-associated peptidase YedK
VKKDGPNVDIETYAFLTTTPNSLVATIKSRTDAGPIHTCDEEFDTWMHGSCEKALALAREYPAERMRIVQEGFDKVDLLKAA